MARVTLTNQEIVPGGITPSYVAAETDGQAITNIRGDVFFHVKNGGGSPITCTIQTPRSEGGVPFEDYTVVVTNAQERMIGPFNTSIHNQSGEVFIDYTDVTSVTVAAFEVKKQ